MDQRTFKDNTTGPMNINEEDSTIYLFGSELYCGWCLEPFKCPVRLKIHCHIEHLATCSCGEEFVDKEALCEHVVYAGCVLPTPFLWSHFVQLPHVESIDEERTSSKCDQGSQKTVAATSDKTSTNYRQKGSKDPCAQSVQRKKYCCEFCPYETTKKSAYKIHVRRKHSKAKRKSVPQNCLGGEQTGDSATNGYTKRLSTASNLAQSIAAAKKLLARKCRFCQRVFSQQSNCRKHELCCRRVLKCKFCQQVFAGLWYYKKHEASCRLLSVNSHVQNKQTEGSTATETTASSPSKWLPSALNSAKSAESAKNILSRKCRFCQRVCSSLYNCRRHEVTCVRVLKCKFCNKVFSNITNYKRHEAICHLSSLDCSIQNKLSSDQQTEDSTGTVYKIPANNIFYCSRCGFSDFDQHVVEKHLEQPHVFDAGNRLVVKPQTGHDYIGSMRTSPGNFWCSLCGSHQSARSKMLAHLLQHSSPVKTPVSGDAAGSESTSVEVKEDFGEQQRKWPSASDIRMCFRCRKSFTNANDYFKHRSACSSLPTVVQQSSPVKTTDNANASGLESVSIKVEEDFGQEGSRCTSASHVRMCSWCRVSFTNADEYIMHRARCQVLPNVVQNIPQSQDIPNSATTVTQDIPNTATTPQLAESRPTQFSYLYKFCEQTSDGRWKCKFCDHHAIHRGDLYKHIRAKHNEVLDTKMEAKKKQRLEISRTLIEKTADDHWKCKLCDYSASVRNILYRHFRDKHNEVLKIKLEQKGTVEENDKQKVNKTTRKEMASGQRKCSHGRSCPKCSRSFASVAKYLSHRAVCRAVPRVVSYDKMAVIREKQCSYLHSFCEQRSDGRWFCKLCDSQSSRHRCDLYKHIRAKHTQVLNTKVETEKKRRLEICKEFSEKTADEQWKCKLCDINKCLRQGVYKHIQSKHKEVLDTEPKLDSAKEVCTEIDKAFSEETADRKLKCVLSAARFGRSCPKCARSFPTVAKYLSHRAMCLSIPKALPEYNRLPVSYLYDFCEKASDGRFMCKLCKHHTAYRSTVYKHIRAKHREVLNPEQEAEVNRCRELCASLMEETADGRWKCKSCEYDALYRGELFRHIRFQHYNILNSQVDTRTQNAAELNKAAGDAKQQRKTADFCVPTSDGRFRCTLCENTRKHRGNLYGHIRQAHSRELLGETSTTCDAVRSHPTVKVTGVPAASRYPAASSAAVVKQCPYCGTSVHRSGYESHVKHCGKHARFYRFMELQSTGRVKCRFCSSTYSCRAVCRVHLQNKHSLCIDALTYTEDDVDIKTETESTVPTDDLASAVSTDKTTANDVLIEVMCKDKMP